MNPLHLALALLLTTITCLAQGQVNFANRVGAGGAILNAPVLMIGSLEGPGPDYSVQLLLQEGDGSLTPLTPTSTFSKPGLGAAAVASRYWLSKTVDVPGVFGGQEATFVVRAWKTALGSYDAAVAAGEYDGYGASEPFAVTLGGPGTDPSVPPNTPTYLLTLKAFTIGFIPEPSTLTLGLLGAAVLVVCRRAR